MAHEVELRRLRIAFAEQLGVRIGRALVHVFGALFAVEIAIAAPGRRRLVRPVLDAEAPD
jgi:hypothetical protein